MNRPSDRLPRQSSPGGRHAGRGRDLRAVGARLGVLASYGPTIGSTSNEEAGQRKSTADVQSIFSITLGLTR